MVKVHIQTVAVSVCGRYIDQSVISALLLVLLVANRITKGLPGAKGMRGAPGHMGHDGVYGRKGGKPSVIHKLIAAIQFLFKLV